MNANLCNLLERLVSPSCFRRAFLLLLLGIGAQFSCVSAQDKAKKYKPARTVAHSIVSPNYQRERLPSGEFKPETYALGLGELIDPTMGEDDSLEALSIEEMANVLSKPLLREGYVPETEAEKTDLLILVNWGKTIPHMDDLMRQQGLEGMLEVMENIANMRAGIDAAESAPNDQVEGPATPGSIVGDAVASTDVLDMQFEINAAAAMQDMADNARYKANTYNARLLGYFPSLLVENERAVASPHHRRSMESLLDEIEVDRYFVILQAYDFQKIVKEKKKELLWMTRFSIKAKGRRFDEELAEMARSASQMFGKESGKLKRGLLPGEITVGELEVVEMDEADKAAIE